MREKPIKSEFTNRTAKLALQALAVCLLLLPLLFLTGVLTPSKARSESVANGANTTAPNPNSLPMRTSYADVVTKVAPAVVTIRSDIKVKADAGGAMPNDPMFQQFFGGRMPQMKQKPQVEHALGSGVIVNADGTILTNAHVVEGADKIKVELIDKRTFDAKVIGADKPSDLAVLKIQAENLPILPLGDSDKVRVGDIVLALGNPLGLQQTVTSGIISAKGRATGLSDGSFEDFLQTDAPINHGNSGGALVNLDGELVGINSQILSPSGGSIGIGFAIPTNMAGNVMAQLVKDGKVHRGMLGVGVQNVTSDLAGNFGLKEVRGVLVNSVAKGSAAEKAGLKQGDVVLSLNGMPINDSNELRNHVAQTAPNAEVTLGVWRDGKMQDFKATLNEFSAKKAEDVNAEGDDSTDNPNEKAQPSGKLGVQLAPITPQTARQLNLKGITEGLVVMGIDENGAAAEAGMQEGDVILQVNRQSVKTAADVQSALAKNGKNPVLLLVSRNGQTIYLTVQPKE